MNKQIEVGELVAMLAKLPQDALVVVDGYEGGYDNPTIREASIVLDDNPDPHCGAHRDEVLGRDLGVPVFVISRREA